jgi:hypothetical protein
LEDLVLDTLSSPWIVSIGNYLGDLRPSFSQNLQFIHHVST